MEQKQQLQVLVIPGMIPFPPNDGGKLCIFGLIDYLRNFHHIQVLLPLYNPYDTGIVQNLRLQWPNVIIHAVRLYEDVPPISAKQQRINKAKRTIKTPIRLLHYLIQLTRPAIEVPLETPGAYYRTNSTPFIPHAQLFVDTLMDILNTNKFDIIQTELTHMLNLVSLFPKEAKKVFVQIESRGDVLYDYGISSGFSLAYINHVAGNARFLEYTYMSHYDAVLALNETDKLQIEKNVPSSVKVYTSPFGILDVEIPPLAADDYKAENLVFMGGESHYPNVDALNWFLTDVLSKFDNRPFKKLYITGYWSPNAIIKLQQLSDCVEFIGFVDDLAPVLKNSVSIVPIRIGGGGIRTKILTAMSYGSPVVATTLSAVWIKEGHQKQLLIADTAQDFANAVLRIFNDDAFARNLAKNAYQLLVKQYSQSAVGAIRNHIYHDICNI